MAQIQFSHANGIPAQTYQFLFDRLRPHTVSYVPAFGLGSYQSRNDWQPLVQELIAAIESTHDEPVVGIGHSLGGVLTCWAALKRPDLFERVILLDPPFLSNNIRLLLTLTHPLGPGFRRRIIPLSQGATRRRAQFDSREEAKAYWREKRFFRDWHSVCFDAYVQHALVDNGQGGLTLRIPADLESHIFAGTPHRLYGGRFEMPSHYLHAVPNGVAPPEVIENGHRKAFLGMGFIPVEGGHMFPVEQPERTADMILRLIGE